MHFSTFCTIINQMLFYVPCPQSEPAADEGDALLVKGMTHLIECPQKVTETLLAVDGVFNVAVNFHSKVVHVWGIADTEALVSALSKAGYASSRYSPTTGKKHLPSNVSFLLINNILFVYFCHCSVFL